jgi:iron complex outermembrane receptor protein
VLVALPLLASAALASPDSDSNLDDDARRRLEYLETLDLDALRDVEIEILSRHPERRFEAPAAVSVIGNERIRQSSMTRLPDLLRYVPGLHVNKIDANKWAISSRNISSRFSNTMLVSMDGRTIYSPLFGGVYWSVQDTLLQDVDRIEVVRGPGLSLWGSNAVNGIVNVVTRSARDTQGSLGYVRSGVGDALADAGGRVGVKVADGAFLRIYGKGRYSDTGKYLSDAESTNDVGFAIGSNADDQGAQGQGGFRLDWYKDPNNEITLQGDGYGGRYYDTRRVETPLTVSAFRNRINVGGGNLLGRWLHRYASGGESTFRVYWDYTYRSDDAFRERRHTADFDWQHRLEIEAGDSWIPAQRITWGAGARLTRDDTDQVAAFFLDPQNRTSPMGSAFLQDRIALVAERLFAIVGTKWEHNDFSGSEF